MDLFDETTIALKGVWESETERQNAKIVLYKAIASATYLGARDCDAVFAELDRILLKEEKDTITRPDPAR